MKYGRVFEHVTARADILGRQKNPWGFENIKSKFQANVALVLSEQGVEDAVNAWSNQMQGSTPSKEWNVQALITHNIQVAVFVEGLLQENITVNPLDVSGGIPRDDPLKVLDANVAKVMDIIKASGYADTQINTPFGEMTRGQFMMTPTWGLVVHEWDLAK